MDTSPLTTHETDSDTSTAPMLDALFRQLLDNYDPRLHVGYDEAAHRLGVSEKWLRERIGSLPHRKLGKGVQFTLQDLQEISEMAAVRPEASPPQPRPSHASLSDIKPVPRPQRRAA